VIVTRARHRAAPGGAEPLSPRNKWRAILLSTLLLAPALWAIVAGAVAATTDDPDAPAAAPFIAFGLAVIPFVFVALAFLSQHPRAPGAVVRAMGMSLLVGIPVSAVAADAVTGLVAGAAAGGAMALRREAHHSWKTRALAVLAVTAYTFLTVRVVPEAALIAAPMLPFTAIGLADHVNDRKLERAAA
jgi:hypothetical protein